MLLASPVKVPRYEVSPLAQPQGVARGMDSAEKREVRHWLWIYRSIHDNNVFPVPKTLGYNGRTWVASFEGSDLVATCVQTGNRVEYDPTVRQGFHA